MTPRDDYILSIRLPTPSAASLSLAADQPPGPDAPSGSGRRPPSECAHIFCDKPATDGDLCAPHAELMKDIRAEYEHLRADYEDGWTDGD